ncbi:MAG: four helix bundle protein, partial [Planctomycetes bacterium]|nr:four helix bundle protein [Planctomycetota bacterium]
MSKNSYRDLEVWQKAMGLVELCYACTKSFPSEERYGLTDQIRRAAVSIPSNIAEGQTRQHRKEFLQFLSIAQGSLAELETQIQIAERLHYAHADTVREVLTKSD